MRANKDAWILGDVFLTEAVAVLREIQNQNRDDLYLYNEYDPQLYFPKLLSKDTFASQIRCQLATALEEHNKLPALIILILGNKDVDDKVLNPECTRKVWTALFTEISRAIKTRKEDLPRKAKSPKEPRVFITNLFPRFKDQNDRTDRSHESYKTKRRRLNGILPPLAGQFGFKVLPINGILPDNPDHFIMNTGKLSGKGLKQFWESLASELKIQDVRSVEEEKTKIIQEYFSKQREERRIMQERNKCERDRNSLPRSVRPVNLDRGDGYERNVHSQRGRSASLPRNSGKHNRGQVSKRRN